mmetsp:Transcript_146633/g.273051  ORF Transcript_146633/g.273051 Transcript_146633/m.273051 type:complete len:321 (-) Transcript_146633:394-1356(-)
MRASTWKQVLRIIERVPCRLVPVPAPLRARGHPRATPSVSAPLTGGPVLQSLGRPPLQRLGARARTCRVTLGIASSMDLAVLGQPLRHSGACSQRPSRRRPVKEIKSDDPSDWQTLPQQPPCQRPVALARWAELWQQLPHLPMPEVLKYKETAISAVAPLPRPLCTRVSCGSAAQRAALAVEHATTSVQGSENHKRRARCIVPVGTLCMLTSVLRSGANRCIYTAAPRRARGGRVLRLEPRQLQRRRSQAVEGVVLPTVALHGLKNKAGKSQGQLSDMQRTRQMGRRSASWSPCSGVGLSLEAAAEASRRQKTNLLPNSY